jgi:integrase
VPLYRQPKSPYWWIRFSIGGVKVRRSSGTADKDAAEEFEARLRGELWRQRKLGERPRYLWKQAVEQWRAEAQGRDKERDHERLKWFAQYLDTSFLNEITPEVIARLRAVRTAESSPSTANRYMALLRMILRRAQRQWDWIDRVPAVPMVALEKQEPRFITRAQARILLKELAPFPHLVALTEFSLETGLRMRNASGLTWDQVDLRRRTIVIPAARAKTGETIAIPLSSRAIAIVREQRGRHALRVFTFKRYPKSRPTPYLDPYGKEFQAAAKRAGLPGLRWHDLRHTWASWHAQRGTPLHVLQELGGWKSLAMVQRYAHLSTEHLRAYAEHRRGKAAK